jgi:hypothetical protein
MPKIQAHPCASILWTTSNLCTSDTTAYPTIVHGHLQPPSLQSDLNSESVAVELGSSPFPPTFRLLKHGIRAIEVELYPTWHDEEKDYVKDPAHLLEFRKKWFRWLWGGERFLKADQPNISLQAE